MKKHKYKIEQRNEFLDKLGLKTHEYGVNFTDKKDKRRKKWKKQRKKYGFDSRETWNLNDLYAQWLYSHLKLYLKETSEIVDLNYYKFTYDGKEYTQIEAIKQMIKWLEYYLKNCDKDGKEEIALEKVRKATELWAISFPCMWW